MDGSERQSKKTENVSAINNGGSDVSPLSSWKRRRFTSNGQRLEAGGRFGY